MLARFAPCLESNAAPVILSQMGKQHTQWSAFVGDPYPTKLMETQTQMFVPDPVISLAIRPAGTETPNFSRALNRFQKEDPTFKVHVDEESQEVSHPFHDNRQNADLFPSDNHLWHGRTASGHLR